MKGQLVDDLKYYIWLSLCFAFGSDKPDEILQAFNTPRDFYEARASRTAELEFLKTSDIERVRSVSLESAENIIERCRELDINIACIDDDIYPKRLRLIYGTPMVIYYKGDISEIDGNVAIGVVGTRVPNEYTMQVTKWICKDLAMANVIVISGCAVGIDGAAHFGALRGKGRTIGVLGCGLDVDYPHKNSLLKEEMLKRGGALITELPPGTGVRSEYFPVRNRLIAGLSLGVLVTQAPVRSGALITAEHAIEQGKEVYCIPPFNIMSRECMGVMKYIRDGCTVVGSAEDILMDFYFSYSDKLVKNPIIGDYLAQLKAEQIEESDGLEQRLLQPDDAVKPAPQSTIAQAPWLNGNKRRTEIPKTDRELENEKRLIEMQIDGLDEPLKGICRLLIEKERYVDEISAMCKIDVGKTLSSLTQLEIKGLITPLGGRRYKINKN